MAKFCNQCGRPLAEGEICQCRQQMEKAAGEKGTPNLAALCEKEVPIKQYHICNARSRICRLWQEGRIQITNKRIIFHLSGCCWNKKAISHTEFAIDEVEGISVSNGVSFRTWDFLLGFIIGAIVLIISCAAGNPFRTRTGIFATLIVLLVYIVLLLLYAMKPSFSIRIMTKHTSDELTHIGNGRIASSAIEFLPGGDTDVAARELGAVILDVQKLGDSVVEKWKAD
ncbi:MULTISPECIES: hypothetical protein [Clostridia]|uniref:hypothetical protein n=1 Tax=Clostridia TaxID=186801 RepID=UPI0007405998|nr:hypothetical protein [Clostridium sp. C105KSO13]CUX51530.1 hypothetical protein BN3456_03011 [Clostridium sp. C105KSO13]